MPFQNDASRIIIPDDAQAYADAQRADPDPQTYTGGRSVLVSPIIGGGSKPTLVKAAEVNIVKDTSPDNTFSGVLGSAYAQRFGFKFGPLGREIVYVRFEKPVTSKVPFVALTFEDCKVVNLDNSNQLILGLLGPFLWAGLYLSGVDWDPLGLTWNNQPISLLKSQDEPDRGFSTDGMVVAAGGTFTFFDNDPTGFNALVETTLPGDTVYGAALAVGSRFETSGQAWVQAGPVTGIYAFQ